MKKSTATNKRAKTAHNPLLPKIIARQALEDRIFRLEQKTFEMKNIIHELKLGITGRQQNTWSAKPNDLIYSISRTEVLTPIRVSEQSFMDLDKMESMFEDNIGGLISAEPASADDIPFSDVAVQVGSVITVPATIKLSLK